MENSWQLPGVHDTLQIMSDHPDVYRPLGSTGLFCHPLGFGCYRIADGNEDHEAALKHYLERGGNLIDTSANYTDGQSEILVGKILRGFPRDQVIVVTKAGYIQGQNMALARSQTFPEVVKYGEGIWHCIHPEFLETQIGRSSQRLQLEMIDVFLLHNPEYFLSYQSYRKELDATDHDEFYRRIGQAFRFLEDQVQTGKIRWYGISSNNYGLALSDPTMTSVQRCLAEAQRIRSDHHFRVIQLPMNLYESGGALERNNGGQTVLEFSRQHGLGVLVNRPLNAYYRDKLIRLADVAKPNQSSPTQDDVLSLLRPLREQERWLKDRLGVAPTIGDTKTGLAELLEQIVPQLESVDDWERVAGRFVAGPLRRWIEDAGKEHGSDPIWNSWIQQFFPLVRATFEEIERLIQRRQQSVSEDVRGKLLRSGYPESAPSLSQIALSLLMNLECLSCVLVGMRRPVYVTDAFASLTLPRVDSAQVLKNFHDRL
jgi:aryl-alcohol dehydrogenase-like predicted oxidoreductase